MGRWVRDDPRRREESARVFGQRGLGRLANRVVHDERQVAS